MIKLCYLDVFSSSCETGANQISREPRNLGLWPETPTLGLCGGPAEMRQATHFRPAVVVSGEDPR